MNRAKGCIFLYLNIIDMISEMRSSSKVRSSVVRAKRRQGA